jgi:hypothetical protein
VEKDWCWKAAELRSQGLPAPEDPRACLHPCPPVSDRGEEILDLVRMAHRQLRVGFGGAYGLDWNVIARLADDAGITTDARWWELFSIAEGEFIAAITPKKDQPPPEE